MKLQAILNEAERLYSYRFLLEANHFFAKPGFTIKKAAQLAPKELRYQLPLNDFDCIILCYWRNFVMHNFKNLHPVVKITPFIKPKN
jgi:hypothetical protein